MIGDEQQVVLQQTGCGVEIDVRKHTIEGNVWYSFTAQQGGSGISGWAKKDELQDRLTEAVKYRFPHTSIEGIIVDA